MPQQEEGGNWKTGMAVSAALVIQSEVLDQLYNPLKKKAYSESQICTRKKK